MLPVFCLWFCFKTTPARWGGGRARIPPWLLIPGPGVSSWASSTLTWEMGSVTDSGERRVVRLPWSSAGTWHLTGVSQSACFPALVSVSQLSAVGWGCKRGGRVGEGTDQLWSIAGPTSLTPVGRAGSDITVRGGRLGAQTGSRLPYRDRRAQLLLAEALPATHPSLLHSLLLAASSHLAPLAFLPTTAATQLQ